MITIVLVFSEHDFMGYEFPFMPKPGDRVMHYDGTTEFIITDDIVWMCPEDEFDEMTIVATCKELERSE